MVYLGIVYLTPTEPRRPLRQMGHRHRHFKDRFVPCAPRVLVLVIADPVYAQHPARGFLPSAASSSHTRGPRFVSGIATVQAQAQAHQGHRGRVMAVPSRRISSLCGCGCCS